MSTSVQVPQFPAKFSLKPTFNITTFSETQFVMDAANAAFKAEQNSKYGVYAKYAIMALLFLIGFFSNGGFFLGLILAILAFVVLTGVTTFLNYLRKKAYDKMNQAQWDHTLDTAYKVSEVINGKGYGFGDWTFFCYNSNGCVYGDMRQGDICGLSKENIKEVMIEHVHLGSTSVGKSESNTKGSISGSSIHWGSGFSTNSGKYKGKTVTTSIENTTNHYEWRLDILSNFMEYPKISLLFADDKEGEAAAKSIYAVLKP